MEEDVKKKEQKEENLECDSHFFRPFFVWGFVMMVF